MPDKTSNRRRTQFEEVLALVAAQEDFDPVDVHTRCKEAKTQFIGNVLKQLTADRVLGVLKSESAGVPRRFTWIVDRETFDSAGWIEQQFTGGNQVKQAAKEERPRERLLNLGAENLKDSELIAILIRSGRKGESAVQAGQRVAGRFEGKLDGLPMQSAAELKSISPAVSEVAYCQIMAGIELGRRVAAATASHAPRPRINSSHAAIDYCRRQFSRLAHDGLQEEFHVVTLDTKLQPVNTHRITVGTLDASLVHPREVFRPAIRDAASAVLLVHNHPSGDPAPSRQDREVTERLTRSGELLGVRVVDHIIVARDHAVSLAETD